MQIREELLNSGLGTGWRSVRRYAERCGYEVHDGVSHAWLGRFGRYGNLVCVGTAGLDEYRDMLLRWHHAEGLSVRALQERMGAALHGLCVPAGGRSNLALMHWYTRRVGLLS